MDCVDCVDCVCCDVNRNKEASCLVRYVKFKYIEKNIDIDIDIHINMEVEVEIDKGKRWQRHLQNHKVQITYIFFFGCHGLLDCVCSCDVVCASTCLSSPQFFVF